MVGNNDDYRGDLDRRERDMAMYAIKKRAQILVPLSERGSTYLRVVAEQLHALANELDALSHSTDKERSILRDAGDAVGYANRKINQIPDAESSRDRVIRLKSYR